MRFELWIELGNPTMQSGDDVAAALRTIADRLADQYDSLTLPETRPGAVYDGQRNSVGRWIIEHDRESREEIARRVLDAHAIRPEWTRTGEQIAGLLAEAVKIARGEGW